MLRSNCEVDGVKNRCKKLVRENAVAQALGTAHTDLWAPDSEEYYRADCRNVSRCQQHEPHSGPRLFL